MLTLLLGSGAPAASVAHARPLTALGLEHLDWYPTLFRDAPEIQALVHAGAVEMARLEAKIEQVRAQFWPQSADIMLSAWETLLRTTVVPAGQTDDQRRATIHGLLTLASTAEGVEWENAVTALVGAGWSYTEFIPHGSGIPPIYTILITLTVPPGSDLYVNVERRLRDFTPAHLDIQLAGGTGFLLDESQLDQEGLG